jgi:hypothetical protein
VRVAKGRSLSKKDNIFLTQSFHCGNIMKEMNLRVNLGILSRFEQFRELVMQSWSIFWISRPIPLSLSPRKSQNKNVA